MAPTSRRRLMASGGMAATGIAALGLVGCGGGDDDDEPSSPSPSATQTTASGTGSPTAAASAAPSGDKPTPGGILKLIGGPVGGVLDPHRTNTPVEYGVIWPAAGNFLVRFGLKDGLPEPDLAAAMPEIPGDGTELIFKLNTEAKFHDKAPTNGRKVTAEDVKLSFEHILSPDTASPRAGNYNSIDTITVIDEATISFKLKAPQADLLNFMADQYDFVLPKELTSRGKEAVKTMEDVVGSGPFELTSYEAGKGLTMRKRPDGYWKKDTVWLDGLEYIHQVDPQQQANALKAGQVHVVGLPIDLVQQFDKDPKYQIVQAPSSNREILQVNHLKEPYTDPRVRQAIWRAIDRKQMYDKVLGGAGIPGGPMSPAAAAWVLPESELKTLPGFGERSKELAEAKKLLEAAGFPDGFDETIITVTAFSADLFNDVFVANLRDIGINLKTENVGTDFNVLLAREREGTFNLMSSLKNSGPYPDAQLFIYHHSDYPAKGSRNYSRYGSPEMDARLEKQSTIYDFEERKNLVFEIQRDIINNPGPGWVGSRIGFGVATAALQNYAATPFTTAYKTAESYWLKTS